MTQKIKRSELKVIYDSVCQNWQNKIKEELLWNSNDIIKIKEDIILQMYNEVTLEQKKLIEKYFVINNPEKLIEQNNTGNTAFSLLQGIIRHTTHNLADNDEQDLMYGNAATINAKAHNLIFNLN